MRRTFATIFTGFGPFRYFLLSAFLFCRAEGAEPIRLELSQATQHPNIIFILADDLGYGDLGCYGQKRIRTPHIDQLAREGIRFTQCYAGSAVCSPSRAALMTGLHTGHAWIRGNESVPLRAEDLTVAEVLRSAGYKTGVIGKWGLGAENTSGIPNKKGFEQWFGYLDNIEAHNYYPILLWRNLTNRIVYEKNMGGKKVEYSHDLFARAATNFLKVNKDYPFFLYLPFTIPHANNELKDQGMEVPHDEPYSKETWPQMEKNFAAMVTRLDATVGQIVEKLKELKLDENTVIFFASDNGPHKEGGHDSAFFASSGPFRGIKRDLYEGGIRVPLIVRWPGKIKPGTVSDQPLAFWDFLPTAAEIAGAKVSRSLDGVSFLPTLQGRRQAPLHKFLYWEIHENGFQQAVRFEDWKAVRLGPARPLELYNLKTDSQEQKDVASKNSRVLKEIETYLKTARTESEFWPPKLDEKTKATNR